MCDKQDWIRNPGTSWRVKCKNRPADERSQHLDTEGTEERPSQQILGFESVSD